MLRTFSSRVSPAITFGAATRAADADGTAVDLQGFGAALILLSIGAGGITFDATNRLDIILEHSEDSSTWAAVAQADVNGATVATGGIVRSLIAAKAAADVQEIDYIGNRRYVRLRLDFGGTHGTGTPIAATVLRALPDLMPA